MPKRSKKSAGGVDEGVMDTKEVLQAAKHAAKRREEVHKENLERALEKVDEAQVDKAVKALLKHVKLHREKVKAMKKKMDLLEGDDDDDDDDKDDPVLRESSKDFVFVTFALKQAPVSKLTFKAHRIPVKNAVVKPSPNRALCLLVKNKKEAQKWVADQEIPGLKKIVSLQELRTSYHRFQAKRELAAMYDVFLADDRIVCMLPKTLGKTFYSTSKKPIPVRLAQKNRVAGKLNDRIKAAVESAHFIVQGSYSSFKVARVSQSEKEVTENVMDGIAGAAMKVPGRWKNIQAIHIKTGNSAALPVFNSFPQTKTEQRDAEIERIDSPATHKDDQQPDKQRTNKKQKPRAKEKSDSKPKPKPKSNDHKRRKSSSA